MPDKRNRENKKGKGKLAVMPVVPEPAAVIVAPAVAAKGRALIRQIYSRFAENRSKGKNRAAAYSTLQHDLATGAAELVPDYISVDKLNSMLAELENFIKNDQAAESNDPMSLLGEWVRGEKELSRIPLDSKPPGRVQ